MILIKSINAIVNNRNEAKQLLGGTNSYNRALRNKDIIFLNNKTIAINDKRGNFKNTKSSRNLFT